MDLWKNHRDVFGNISGDSFPLLIKIIDAKDDLSIRVHPDDEYAKENENGSLGKTECWYVLDCEEDATIIIGHNAETKEELEKMIADNNWNQLLCEIKIQKGDFFQTDPGCIHAIKGGAVILETQQNSAITYRVYDYDRLQNGVPRELHTEKALDVVTVPFTECKTTSEKSIGDSYTKETLIRCPYYTVEKISLTEEYSLNYHSLINGSVIDGYGFVDNIPIKKGSHFIIPCDYGNVVFKGCLDIIVSYI